MAKSTEHLTEQEVRQQYSKRIRAFLTQVAKCLPDELGMFQSIPNFTVTDITGIYYIEMATIYKKNVLEQDNFVADIFPLGATTSLGEGFLDISGTSGAERLVYFCQETIWQMQYHTGMIFDPVSQNTNLEGWYWLENSINERAIFIVTSEQLFNLIKRVSVGEFD